MKLFILRLTILCLLISVGLFFACNKSNSGNNSTSNNVNTEADDQSMISAEVNNASNDAALSITSQPGTNGYSGLYRLAAGVAVNDTKHVNGGAITNDSLICDASVVIDTTTNPKTITITYNGTNCWGNRTRTGSVVISIPAGIYWEQAGASVSVNFNNLVIKRLSDGKSFALNGHRIMTNVSGGSLLKLPTLGSITHTIYDSLTITFADSATRIWQMANQRVFTYNNGVVITSTGIHSDGTYSDIAAWGVNRFGISFVARIIQPNVISQACNFRVTSGQDQILRSDHITTTITFGLDAAGNPVGCPGSAPYFMQILWTGPNARTVTIFLPYY
jgi:hypothetical protein